MTLEEKLNQLNPGSFEHRSAEVIKAWKDRVPHLSAIKDYVQHPITQELADEARRLIADIDAKLKTDEKLLLNPSKATERAALIGEKRAHKLHLGLFTRNPSRVSRWRPGGGGGSR